MYKVSSIRRRLGTDILAPIRPGSAKMEGVRHGQKNHGQKGYGKSKNDDFPGIGKER